MCMFLSGTNGSSEHRMENENECYRKRMKKVVRGFIRRVDTKNAKQKILLLAEIVKPNGQESLRLRNGPDLILFLHQYHSTVSLTKQDLAKIDKDLMASERLEK